MPITDKLNKVSNGSQPLPAQLSAPKSAGATSASLSSATGWDTTTAKHIRMYQTQVVNGQTVPNQSTISYYKATLSGTTLSNLQLIWSATGADQDYPSGATVDLSLTAGWADDLIDSVSTQHNHDGTHKAITGPSAVFSGTVTASNFIQSGGAGAEGWTLGLPTPNTVTNNGNRSYTLTYADSIRDIKSPGMRNRYTRTVTAPTTCFSLDGTNDFYNRTSASLGSTMTFTDDFFVFVQFTLTSYADAGIVSRYNGTSGWSLYLDSTGQINLVGYNGSSANYRLVKSYQSVPLNKRITVLAQLDMSAHTATSTTSYIMIDDVDVPSFVTQSGTNPTALIQAGNLEIGARNALLPFPGKIHQVAIGSAKITQANAKLLSGQAITPALVTAHNIVSAYANGSTTDINTTNANNLTAQNGATTASDSFCGVNSFGTATGTTDYAITMSVSADGLTEVVQVPEGNTIPTSGGVSAVAYSTQKAPYGMPADEGKWVISTEINISTVTSGAVSGVWYGSDKCVLTIPVGSWIPSYEGTFQASYPSNSTSIAQVTFSASASSDTIPNMKRWQYHNSNVSNIDQNVPVMATGRSGLTLTAHAAHYLIAKLSSTHASNLVGMRGDLGTTVICAKNAYL